jgi:[ribosomal protein S5]-alanine N-acetyltransferase
VDRALNAAPPSPESERLMPSPAQPLFSLDLETPRLRIRAVAQSDLADLLVVNSEPQVTRFLPYATWQSMADAQAWYERMQALVATGTGRQLVVQHKANDHVVGTVLLFKWDEASARLELGYVLGQAHWRQGLMREALGAVLGTCLQHAGVRRIEAEVNPDNAASHALLLKLGFTHEGRARQRWVAKGSAYDTNLYGLLATEWLAAS